MTTLLDALLRRDIPSSILVARRTEDTLTDNQAELLAWVAAYMDRESMPPTMREVCDRFGWTSTNSVTDHFALIERKGYIRRAPRRARGLWLTDLGKRWWAEQRRAAS